MANTATTFAVLLALVPLLVFTAAAQTDFLQSLTAVDLVASTVPANGDVNPYGVFIVPKSVGNLVKGNLLVSNFNNASNVQGNNPVLLILHTHTKKKKGTGTTIVQISPDGQQTLFAQLDPTDFSAQECPGGIGLTTALVVLRRGWVIVGSLPTVDNVSQNGSTFHVVFCFMIPLCRMPDCAGCQWCCPPRGHHLGRAYSRPVGCHCHRSRIDCIAVCDQRAQRPGCHYNTGRERGHRCAV